MSDFSLGFLGMVEKSLRGINIKDIDNVATIISNSKRVFLLGSGGGAGHASHACADFRKLCNIECYSVYDNTSETTARTNDQGWGLSAIEWLKVSKFGKDDCLFVISVGGGTDDVSKNISTAVVNAKMIGANIVGIVGKRESYTANYADAVIIIPAVDYQTPIVEGLQSVILHLLCTHPLLKKNNCVW